MIERLNSPQEATIWSSARRETGQSVGFVPTMGALHTGHLTLVERALQENDAVCVSVFVNPLQFGEQSDLDNYPRNWEEDALKLAEVGCQMVFTGSLDQFFPGQLDAQGALPAEQLLSAGPGALGLEGECRSGHFEGVATIVQRLFDVVEPTRAYFGQKDFQQTLVVRELALVAGSPEIVVCPISREPSGLARSSRNERLSPEERGQAVCLSRALAACCELWTAGERDPRRLETAMRASFNGAGVGLEYAAVRDSRAWSAETPTVALDQAVALVAARVGPVRLIDNHLLAEPFPRSHK